MTIIVEFKTDDARFATFSDQTYSLCTFDGYYNVKALCKSQNKKFIHYLLENTQEWETIKAFFASKFGNAEDLYFELEAGSKLYKGIYVHRIAVPFIARWCSTNFALHVAAIMDSDTADKSRNVPRGKENSFIYMMYRDSTYDKEKGVKIKLVRRNKASWDTQCKNIERSNECLFIKRDLPIAMTVNEAIKSKVKEFLPECTIKGCEIITKKEENVDVIVSIAKIVIATFRY